MKRKMLLLIGAMLALIFSQAGAVSITVSNGMVVQTYIGNTTPSDTAAMGRIVLDGDVTDYITSAETGKVLGKVTSSVMTGNNFSFAGLGLTGVSGTRSGTVTRITGVPEEGATPYQCTLNSAPTNMPVYYIVKQNGADYTANVSFAFEYDGNVNPKYAIMRWFAPGPWELFGDGTNASPILANNVVFKSSAPGGERNVVIGVHTSGLLIVYARIMLEGPWDISGDPNDTGTYKMKRNAEYIANLKLTNPGETPFYLTYFPTPVRVTVPNPTPWEVRDQNSGYKLLDWVEVHVRADDPPGKPYGDGPSLGSNVGFVDVDGYLLGEDGTPGIPIPGVQNGNYYIVVYNQNHLPVQSWNIYNPDSTGTFDTSIMTGYPGSPTPGYWDFTKKDNCYHNNLQLPEANRHEGVTQLFKVNPVPPFQPVPINFYALFAGNTALYIGSEWGIPNTGINLVRVVWGDDPAPIFTQTSLDPPPSASKYGRSDCNFSGHTNWGTDVAFVFRNNPRVSQAPFPLRLTPIQ